MKITLSNVFEARAQPLRWMVFAAFAAMLLWSCRAFLDFGEWFMQLQGKNVLERGSIGANEWWCFLSRATRAEQQRNFAKVHRQLAKATHGGVEPAHVIFYENTLIIVNPEARLPSQTLDWIKVVRSEDELPDEILSKGSRALMRSEKELASDLEDAWIWAAELDLELPSDAKVFLNEPSLPLYYFSTFIWYPRQVDVDAPGVVIRDFETFDRVFKTNPSRLDPRELGVLEEKLHALGYTHLVIRQNGALQMVSLRAEAVNPQ